MERAAVLFGKATFVINRDYVIRLTAKRRLLYHNKWVFSTGLRNCRKSKVKLPLYYKEKAHWCIEEYFRVRKLKAINTWNFYITLCMAFLAHISMKPETNALKAAIIMTANPIKKKYLSGITGILSYTKEGTRPWFRAKRPAYHQLCLKLAV